MGKRRSYFQIFLAFILKFLNFLQSFMGISIIIYSFFMFNRWRHHHRVPSKPPSLPPSAPLPFYMSNPDSITLPPHDIAPLKLDDLRLYHPAFAAEVTELDQIPLHGIQVNSHHLPTPWFIYAFMGMGIALCLVTFIGHIAAEAINGCCLCFYTLLTTLFILFEVGLVAFIALDQQWEEDLPADSTGELAHLRAFIGEHMDVCKWVGIAVIIIQVLTLLLSIILRALVNQNVDLDDESDHDISGRPWEPLLHPHLSQASGSVRSDIRGGHSDIWSAHIREKYGLDGNNGEENQNV